MNFHKDELIWRDDNHQHDDALTRLTALESTDEFERQIFLMRIARAFGGIGTGGLRHRQSRELSESIQKFLVSLIYALLLRYDRLIGLRNSILKISEPSIFKSGKGDALDNKQSIPQFKGNIGFFRGVLGKLGNNLVGYLWLRDKIKTLMGGVGAVDGYCWW